MTRVFYVLLATVIAMGAFLGYFFFLEPPYLTYENLPFPPHLKQVRQGEVMPLTVRRCNRSDEMKAYIVAHELQSLSVPPGKVVVMPSQLTTALPGCETVTSLINLVPAATPPGVYRVVGAALIEGHMSSHVVPWYSESFEVLP